MEYKRIIGYEKLDNMLTGFILGFLAIGLAYFAQMTYYNVDALGELGSPIKVNILKLILWNLVFFVINL